MSADAKSLDAFATSPACFAELLEFCDFQGAALDAEQLETQLDRRGRRLLDQLLADYLQLRAQRQADR